MLPNYNSFHQNSGQAHPAGGNGGSSAPSPQQQQGMPFNPSLANSCNMLPPSMGPQPGFMNLSNNLLPMQNNHMRVPMSQFGSLGPISQPGYPSVGFCGPQNNALNMNLAASYPFNGQFCNMGQNLNQVNQNMGFLPGQLFGNNLLNLQQMNQNIGPYGQFCPPNLLNRNQVVPMQMQMQSPCQGGPNFAFGGSNQAPQAAVLQNPAFFATPNSGNVHSPNQAGQQINQNQQNNVFRGTQGNHIKAGGVYNSNSDRKTSPSKNFIKHPKRGLQPQGGFQKSQFHQIKNAKGKFAFANRQNRKAGLSNEKEGKSALPDSMNQGRERKRSLSLSYTEQEVQLWREGRRKNYPSNTNIEKKLSEKMIDSEAIEREAKARREQLKEILTKQAEMGVEVAEIPSHYLSDSAKQGNGREENKSWTNNRRSQNKFVKRDRYDKKDRFAKRQRSGQKDSSNDPSFSKREPTLLQKLLSSDIKRDKSRLCQVFRFMVTNSFFKDFPDKPLKFPTVVVKESVVGEGVVEDLSSVAGKGAYGGRDKSMFEKVGNNDYKDCCRNDDCVEDEEEEGEIIN
ncbi:uncharacterized protein LOC112193145 isoform X2 [Rosa chinensis]|uniref:uncharacterized protein LOC112193145 isoform X2 n=1 Tax=Rosa chinensis TaxID=74649 RepID=UPI000D095BB7|nr:uncharacterized protein LOC112193145 isoform X2 [Rosa chinensis]